MVEESSAPPAEESIEAESSTAIEPESDSGESAPDPGGEPGFVCECEPRMRSACRGLGFFKQHEGRHYCVLHYPAKDKSAEFKVEFDRKLANTDFDFRGVWFPDDVHFGGLEFSADAYFSHATFSAAADFNSVTFRADAYFNSAAFSAGADFSSAAFSAAATFTSVLFSADASFFKAAFSADAAFVFATFSAAAFFFKATFTAGADFRFATFSAVSFNAAMFSGDANFNSVTFSDVADFIKATFSAVVSFNSATFSADASFSSTTFSAAADFSYATFSAGADFSSATFKSDTAFDQSIFHARALFTDASFHDAVRFFGSTSARQLKDGRKLPAMVLGEKPALDFQHVRIEHPDRVAFHTLFLHPHWFVNVDPRQFVFTHVFWPRDRRSLEQEVAALTEIEDSARHRLLERACRQLAEKAESNNRYEEASRFRYWAMDLARRDKWKAWEFWKTDWLHVMYWAVSGYGERILRALGVLAAVLIVFALLYTEVGFVRSQENSVTQQDPDTTGQPLSIRRAFTYSFGVMSLQRPEPKPLTNWAHALVTLETVLGPVQGALLLLAIRRKFMR